MEPTFPSPEAAAQAGDSPATDVWVVEVAYSPDGRYAIVFLEYNPGSTAELYEELCERTRGSWSSLIGSSGGGMSWKPTSERGELGVITRWDPPRAEWNTPPPGELSARTPGRRA